MLERKMILLVCELILALSNYKARTDDSVKQWETSHL